MNADIVALTLALGSSYAAGSVASLAVRRGLPTWYGPLHKPDRRLPGHLIGAFWRARCGLMVIAAWLAWRAGGDARGIAIVFGAQLLLDALWPVIFFGARRPDVAFVEILFLWLAVLTTTLLFARSSLWAAALMLPHLAWVAFAGSLNYRIWRLNARRGRPTPVMRRHEDAKTRRGPRVVASSHRRMRNDPRGKRSRRVARS